MDVKFFAELSAGVTELPPVPAKLLKRGAACGAASAEVKVRPLRKGGVIVFGDAWRFRHALQFFSLAVTAATPDEVFNVLLEVPDRPKNQAALWQILASRKVMPLMVGPHLLTEAEYALCFEGKRITGVTLSVQFGPKPDSGPIAAWFSVSGKSHAALDVLAKLLLWSREVQYAAPALTVAQ